MTINNLKQTYAKMLPEILYEKRLKNNKNKLPPVGPCSADKRDKRPIAKTTDHCNFRNRKENGFAMRQASGKSSNANSQ